MDKLIIAVRDFTTTPNYQERLKRLAYIKKYSRDAGCSRYTYELIGEAIAFGKDYGWRVEMPYEQIVRCLGIDMNDLLPR